MKLSLANLCRIKASCRSLELSFANCVISPWVFEAFFGELCRISLGNRSFLWQISTVSLWVFEAFFDKFVPYLFGYSKLSFANCVISPWIFEAFYGKFSRIPFGNRSLLANVYRIPLGIKSFLSHICVKSSG